MVGSNIPENMWPHAYKTAAYIANRTPTKRLGWKTPFEAFTKSVPTIAHMHPFGCRAYPLIYKIPKLQKMRPRAQIGYLMGYDSTNIFWIWIPSQDRVIRIRDVRFNDNLLYDPSDLDLTSLNSSEAKRVVERLEIPEVMRQQDQELDKRDGYEDTSDYDSDTIVVNNTTTSTTTNTAKTTARNSSTPQQLPTPSITTVSESNPTTSGESSPVQESLTYENASASSSQAKSTPNSASNITNSVTIPLNTAANTTNTLSLRSSVSATLDEEHIIPTKRIRK